MDRVVGLAGGARESVAGFSKEILRLGPQVAKGPQELGEALYFVASAGIAVDKQMQVVKLSAQAAAAGLGQTQQVADAVTSALNAYGPAVITAARATDVLVNTVKFGKGEAEAFAPVIGTVATLAATLGVRFEEVGAALAAQTRLGTTAETAAIQLQATFSSLLKVTPKQADALASVGLSAEGLRKELKEKGLLAILETLKTSFGDNTAAMAEAFPNIRALRGLLSLLGENADSTREVFDGMKDSTGALAHAFDAVSKGEAFRFKQTMASLQAIGIQLGAIFSPLANVIAKGANAALGVVQDFLDELSEAKTIRTKLAVVWEGVEDAADGAQDLLGRAIGAVDFDKVFAEARGIADGLQKRLEEVDFSIVGERIGDAFVDAVKVAVPAAKEMAERVNAAVGEIDFEELGKRLGPALAAAIVTAFVTLADPAFWIRNWDLTLAVAATVFRARILGLAAKVVAPLRRLGSDLVLRIGVGMLSAFPRLGGVLIAGLSRLPAIAARALAPLTRLVARVFGRLGRIARFVVTVLGIQAALNAVAGFAQKVAGVFAGLGRSIAGALDRAWEAMKRDAIRAALDVVEPFTHLPSIFGTKFRDAKNALQAQLDEMGTSAEATARRIQTAIDKIEGRRIEIVIDTVVNAPGGPRRPEEGAARASGQAVEQQARAVQTVAASAGKAVETSSRVVTNTADKAKKAAAKARKAFEALVDALSLDLEQAQAIKSLRDDLRALRDQEAAIRDRIKAVGRTTDLERQLFQVEQQRADIQKQITEQRRTRRQGAQFEALGLTATGEQRVPGVGALSKRLGNLREQVKGTFLDTDKTRKQLAQIGKVLSGAFGKVGRDVRAAILQAFNSISDALEGGAQKGPQTKFKKGGFGKLIENVTGLTPAQIKELRQSFSQFGAGGTVPGRGVSAFGLALPAGVGAGAPIAIDLNATLVVDGKEFTAVVTRQQQKQRGRGSASRRGVRPGI